MEPRAIRMRSALAVTTALLSWPVAGCASSVAHGRGAVVRPTASMDPSSPPRTQPSTQPSSGRQWHGLLLLVDIGPNATIEAIDPHGGSVTARETYTVPSGVRANEITFGRNFPGLAVRSSFTASLGLVAAQGPAQADGAAPAGVLDPQGRFTPLTPPTRGYGSPQVYVPLGFDAGGRLWYTTDVDGAMTTHFASVDPARGMASTRPEHVPTGALHVPDGGPTGAAFWLGREGPFDAGALTAEQFLPLPGGTAVAEALDQSGADCPDGGIPWGWHVGPVDAPLTNTPELSANNGCLSPEPDPAWPLGPSRFLTTQGDVGGFLNGATQIYDNHISGNAVHATPLLPQSDRVVTDVVADPGGTSAAFISTAASTKTMYTVSLSGGQPRAVLQLPDDPQADYTLFDWR